MNPKTLNTPKSYVFVSTDINNNVYSNNTLNKNKITIIIFNMIPKNN